MAEIKLTSKQEEILNIIQDMGPMVKNDMVAYLANTTSQAVGRVTTPLSRMDLILIQKDNIDEQWIYSIREEKLELVKTLLVDIQAREADILQVMENTLKEQRKKTMEKIDYPPNHDAIMFSAFRYALGRRTYVVSEIVDYLLKHWDNLGMKYRVLVIKEIYEAIESGGAGMDMDVRQWRKLIDFELGNTQRPIKVKEQE